MTTSSDGRTWSNPDIIGYSADWHSIAFACGKYVAAGNGYVAVSADGTNWSINKISNTNNRTWNDVQYCNGHFIVVGNSGYIATSPDGRKALPSAVPPAPNPLPGLHRYILTAHVSQTPG